MLCWQVTSTRRAGTSAAVGSVPNLPAASVVARRWAATIAPHEYAKVDPADLDKAGVQADAWKHQCVVPMQYLMNVMSMIPKKKKKKKKASTA